MKISSKRHYVVLNAKSKKPSVISKKTANSALAQKSAVSKPMRSSDRVSGEFRGSNRKVLNSFSGSDRLRKTGGENPKPPTPPSERK